jgi:DNA-directed RNA polymerase subunit N (RpoN/RPB10)
MKYLKCRLCGKVFVDEYSVLQHLLEHEDIKEVMSKCLSKYYITTS